MIKQQIQEYWDRQPCNINHSQKPLGSAEYWQEVTAKKYRAEPHILDFANHSAWSGKRVLEVGCGLGTDAEQFARAGAVYTGIDFSPRSAELTQQRFDTFGLTGRIFSADIETVELSQFEPPYDLVYSFGVLHHTPNATAAVNNIRKLMAAGSEFRLMLYAKHSWKNALIESGYAQPEAQSGCPLAQTYDEAMVRHLLKDFSKINVEQAHIWPWQVDLYKQNIWQMEPWFAAMPADMFAALEKKLGWHLLITAKY